MSKVDGRVTTREFYKALLEIKPELEKLNSSVERLQRWAFSDNGRRSVDTRLENIESFMQSHKAENRIIRIFARILLAFLGLLTGLAADSILGIF